MQIKIISKQKVTEIYEYKIAEFNLKIIHNILVCGAILSRWNNQYSGECEICQQVENVFHLLYECKMAKQVWKVIGNCVGTNINDADIFIGRNNSVSFNNMISQVAYSIYKYRLQTWETRECRNFNNLCGNVSADLKYKKIIFKNMGHFQYVNLIDKILLNL